ncbi:MAG: MASE1 domain-containing protein [Caulobacterales bacterium]
MAARAPTRFDRAVVTAVLCAGYLASVAFSVFMSRPVGEGAALWTANGFLAGALILLPGAWRLGAAAICLVSQVVISLAVGDGFARSLLYPLVNLIEAGLAAYLALEFCGARARRLSLRKLTLILLGAVIPAAAVGGAVGAGIGVMVGRKGFLSLWLDWAAPGGLGMAIVLPAVLLVARSLHYRDFERSGLEMFSLLGGVSALTLAVFLQGELPLFFLIFPALTLVAFRLGPAGAAVAGFLVAVIALPLTLLGHGPSTLAAGLDLTGRVRLTQLFVAAALFTTVATAGALADQARMRRLMIGRDRAARGARLRAREAESLAAEALEVAVAAPPVRRAALT